MSATVLDRQRLGKQRVETLQILNCIVGARKGWANHPAVKMWKSNPNGLAAYGLIVCMTWRGRGYADTCADKITSLVEPDYSDMPSWWGDDRIHSSHRSNLLKKFPEHYSKFGWVETSDIPYFWPAGESRTSS